MSSDKSAFGEKHTKREISIDELRFLTEQHLSFVVFYLLHQSIRFLEISFTTDNCSFLKMASSACSKFVIKIVLMWNSKERPPANGHFVQGNQQNATKKRGQVSGRGVVQFDK